MTIVFVAAGMRILMPYVRSGVFSLALFRSSAHPAGPTEPSCTDLCIWLAACLLRLSFASLALALSLSLSSSSSSASSLSLSLVSFCHHYFQEVNEEVVVPVMVVMVVTVPGAKARIACFSKLEPNCGQRRRHLRATAPSRRAGLHLRR